MLTKSNPVLRRRQVIAVLIFLALFPGFFFYHTLLGKGYIPPVLGGFFGPVVIITFPIVFYIYSNDIGKYKEEWTGISAIFILLMAFSIIVSIINFADGRAALGNREMLTWSLSGVIFNLATYMLARIIPVESKKFTNFIYISLVAMLFIALLNMGDAGIFYIKQESADKEIVATYQGFARSIAVVAVIAISLATSFISFGLVVLSGAVALFVNGARTEFACFLVSVSFLSCARFGFLKSFSMGAGFIGVMIIAIYGLSPENYDKFIGNNRSLQLFELADSTSVEARGYLSNFAIRTISESPMLGDYASYLKIGGVGSYSHNILSAWVNLGILGFSVYCMLLGTMVVSVIKNWRYIRLGKVRWNLLVAFSSFAIVAMVFGKDYSYMVFGLAVGFYARTASCRNIDEAKFSPAVSPW